MTRLWQICQLGLDSGALCDIRALSSVKSNPLMTIRLILVLAFNRVTLNRLASFLAWMCTPSVAMF